MRRLLISAFLFLPPVIAQAQESSLKIDCHQLALKQLHEDPEYIPGVDVNGNPVLPADIETPIEAITYPIQIPIEIDLLKWMELESDEGLKLDPEIADITVYEDGRVEYNGQDISKYIEVSCAGAIDSEVEKIMDVIESEDEAVLEPVSEPELGSGPAQPDPVQAKDVMQELSTEIDKTNNEQAE